ncbi:unnamed protein product [Camellia sinensis]
MYKVIEEALANDNPSILYTRIALPPHQSTIPLLPQIRILLGKKYKVIEETLAFVGDVHDASRFVSPDNLYVPIHNHLDPDRCSAGTHKSVTRSSHCSATKLYPCSYRLRRRRMEKLDLKVQSSQAKSIGTILSITGAYIVVELVKSLYNSYYNVKKKKKLISPCHQTWIIKDYPAEMVVTLFGCIFVTILSAIVALIVERDPNAWTLKPDVELITIVYSAVFMVSIRSVIYAWVCRIKGPVFVSTFRPLGMAFAVFMGVTFLKDTLHIGSVIGAVIIALGLYAVMWGKAIEVQIIEENVISRVDSSSDKVPLLQNKSME